MEHRLIQGGEQYLPFARSCVAKLKGLGMPYASQQYEIDGVSIKVRIEPGHEYIRIEGGTEIISGVVRLGEIVSVTNEETGAAFNVLRAFKPTPNTWRYPLHKSVDVPTTAFSDMKKLANVAAPYDTQYADLSPSSYSGLMAKAVAIIMARGLPVKYYYNWSLCHGIVLASDGKPWLVEISADNGVIAMKLPTDPGVGSSKVDAERESMVLFKGIPNGAEFPTQAVEPGKVITLASVKSMESYFEKTAFREHIGWSFNDTGSEARNTCYATSNTGVVTSYLFKLLISINITPEGATGSAELTQVASGPLTVHPILGPYIAFSFGDVAAVPSRTIPEYDLDETHAPSPLFTYFANGAFDTVWVENTAVGATFISEPSMDDWFGIYGQQIVLVDYTTYDGATGGRRVFSSVYAGRKHSRATKRVNTQVGTFPGNDGASSILLRVDRYDPYTGLMFCVHGCRDALGVVSQTSGVSHVISYRVYIHLPDAGDGYGSYYYPGGGATGGYDTATYFDDGGYGSDLGAMTGFQYLQGLGVFKVNYYVGSNLSFAINNRYTSQISVPKGGEFGPLLDRGTFRANVLGPSPQAAFIVPQYNYYWAGYYAGVEIPHDECGATKLVGDMVEGDEIVLGRKYNFIGYIK